MALTAQAEIKKYLSENPRRPRKAMATHGKRKSFVQKMKTWGPKELTMNIYVLDEEDVLAMILKDRRMKKAQ